MTKSGTELLVDDVAAGATAVEDAAEAETEATAELTVLAVTILEAELAILDELLASSRAWKVGAEWTAVARAEKKARYWIFEGIFVSVSCRQKIAFVKVEKNENNGMS